MIVKPIFTALLLLLLLSVTCRAQALTERYIVELQQNTDSPDKSFSIQQHYPHTLPKNPSIITKINNYEGSDSPANNIPPGPRRYGLHTAIIESISWHVLYATHALVAYDLTLTTKDVYINSNTYSWLPFIVVGSLLSSYWNPDSPMFNRIGQHELSQDYPFVITTMAPSPGDNPQQSQLSASSGQQASGTTTQLTSSFTSPLDSGYGNGNGDPEQHRHTYGLDCYVDSCNGVCRFRSPSDSQELAEAGENCPICFDKFSNAMVTPCCSQKIDTYCLRRVFLTAPRWTTKTCPFCRADMDFLARSPDLALSAETQQGPPGRYNEPRGRFPRTAFFALSERVFGPRTCNEALIGEDGQQRRCGKVCKNIRALLEHKSKHHSKPQTCNLTVMSRPCLKVCKNVQALAYHKVKCHSRQKTRDVTDVGKDGQQRPRGKVCRNTRAPVEHKREHRNR
ncbi:hypothetical protein [Endozoicomonas sp. ALB032]|uniref:hypothetical protein n=1 Tax=Endozoicomonas sp. ALB032 TaxID=3403082 RepID=UPI003BB6199F